MFGDVGGSVSQHQMSKIFFRSNVYFCDFAHCKHKQQTSYKFVSSKKLHIPSQYCYCHVVSPQDSLRLLCFLPVIFVQMFIPSSWILLTGTNLMSSSSSRLTKRQGLLALAMRGFSLANAIKDELLSVSDIN